MEINWKNFNWKKVGIISGVMAGVITMFGFFPWISLLCTGCITGGFIGGLLWKKYDKVS